MVYNINIMKEKLHLSGGNRVLFIFWGILFAVAFFVFILSLSVKATFLALNIIKII